jgi:hypothetical protein
VKDKEKNIVINNEKEFSNLMEKSDSYYSTVQYDYIHFKNVNFNLLDPAKIRSLLIKKICFENCVLGNLHYLNFRTTEDIYLTNQCLDSYFMNSANPIKKIYLDNNYIDSLSVLACNRYYHLISIKNNNIKGKLSSLKNTVIDTLMLEDYEKYTISDFEFLKEKLQTKKIIKLLFNDIVIDEKKLFYLERKIKIQKLIKINA